VSGTEGAPSTSTSITLNMEGMRSTSGAIYLSCSFERKAPHLPILVQPDAPPVQLSQIQSKKNLEDKAVVDIDIS
jgi:hypothetical protein